MNYGLIRRKVADFSKWRTAYDANLSVRQKAGLKEKYVLHNIDNPNEVITLFELDDLQKARELSRVSQFLTFSFRKLLILRLRSFYRCLRSSTQTGFGRGRFLVVVAPVMTIPIGAR
jgi:hypothetical protein